jgi:hypothetical protein
MWWIFDMPGRDRAEAGLRNFRTATPFAALALVALISAGCAGGSGGDPGARPLPVGQTCQSLRAQLDRLLAKGVQGKVEALSAGRKLSPGDKAEAEAYNGTLNSYLGARCHVAPA